MLYARPWYRSDIQGYYRAKAVDANIASKIIKNSEKPVFVVGELITRDKEAVEILKEILKKLENSAIIATTPNAYKEFAEFNVYYVNVVDTANLIVSEDWKGLDGSGKPDLMIVLGMFHVLMEQTLSTVRNFSDIKSLAIDRFFQNNATYSFPNLTREEWLKYLKKLADSL